MIKMINSECLGLLVNFAMNQANLADYIFEQIEDGYYLEQLESMKYTPELYLVFWRVCFDKGVEGFSRDQILSDEFLGSINYQQDSFMIEDFIYAIDKAFNPSQEEKVKIKNSFNSFGKTWLANSI